MARVRLAARALSTLGVLAVILSGPVEARTVNDVTSQETTASATGGPIQFGAAQAAYPGATKIQAIQNLEAAVDGSCP